jgi:Phage integrase, N-terminal SAM-like domain
MVERPKKILDRFGDVIRLKHYSYRAEQTYVDWVYHFIVFHNKRHLITLKVRLILGSLIFR